MAQGFDVDAARKAGYSDDEILQHLTQSRKFDIEGALKSGYSKQDIISHLSGAPATAQPSAQPKSWSDQLGLQNPVLRGATDFVEGAASGAASTVFNGGDMIRRGLGMERVINRPEVQHAMAAPDSFMGGAGKFAEQGAELLVPLSKVANATKGASLLGRTLANGLASGAASAVQTGGDPVATAAGTALGAAPAALGGVSAATKGKVAEKVYQSALKPTWSMVKSEGLDMLKTGLKEEIPVSHEGLDMAAKRVADLQKQISDGITMHAAQGRAVDTSKVLAELGDLRHFYENTAAPEESLKILDKLQAEFAQYHGQQIPIDKAQQIKINTYQQLREAYGEMKSAKIEGLKNIARGLKEQIESVFPEAASLNEQQSKVLGLQDALYRAVWRIENHQLMGIGSPIAASAGGAIMGGPGAVAGLLGKFVLDDPTIKSKVAIRLARAGVKNPMAVVNQRFATIGDALKTALQEGVNSVSGPVAPTQAPGLAGAQ